MEYESGSNYFNLFVIERKNKSERLKMLKTYRAKLKLIDGLITDCGRIAAEEIKKNKGRFDVSTLKEPYRLEGKKTMGYEIAEQFNWELPDVIIYPTG